MLEGNRRVPPRGLRSGWMPSRSTRTDRRERGSHAHGPQEPGRHADIGIVVVIGAGIAAAHAQRIWAGGYGRTPPRFPTATTFDGSFHFCRVMFTSDRREKQGWGTDYPGADINFSVRLAELTKVRVTMARDGDEAVPDAVVVRLTDDALFQCPFIFMEDAGTARFTDDEVGRLRDYLLKGGFLLVSDYHGTLGAGAVRRGDRTRAAAGRVSRSSISRRPIIRCGSTMFPVDAPAADGVDSDLAPQRRRHDRALERGWRAAQTRAASRTRTAA